MTDPQDQKVQRRLAVILATDVVGFSTLMGQDEEGTLARIKSLRREVIEPKVDAHHGRVVKTTGDGILAEFTSPVEAVRCAVEVQQAVAVKDPQGAAQALRLRIGINLGDIIIEDDGDIYGDGVNVAARLEQMAEPGGVWLSGKVYEEVRDKLPYAFADRGEQTARNIARPVRVYSLLGEKRKHGSPAEKPSRPAIAILPFANADDDPGRRYFSNGFTEDIIVELSRFRQLAVISGSTSFRFRDADARSLGKTLGVQFVLEGSVRRWGRQIRIFCQLVDAFSGEHIWTERFDRDEQEIFEVQDQLVRVIVGTLVGRVQAAGAERARSKPPANLAAYECVLRGNALPMGDLHAEDEARRWYRKAIKLDPGYGRAYAKLAHYLQLEWFRDVNV
ncbi:adenylate/guanylate cyclase domain-containing protein [Microvirga calopogonii]|uniref:adenylate/guanylate cyclase domain-containing protein n=1 Tax=Microvirga calopogonii TaxID=2078013 RepID=UPI0013B41AC8|nr:adenylate/guanylate cyclase domain-containing protein [Microvirga calopogonii]